MKIKNLVSFLKSFFKKKEVLPEYEYGTLSNGLAARKQLQTGYVEVLLWKAGEQGHLTDKYHLVGSGWEKTFKKE